MSDYLDSIEEGDYEEEIEDETVEDIEPTDADLDAIEAEEIEDNPLLRADPVEEVEEEVEEVEDVVDMYTMQIDGEDVEVTLEDLMKGYGTTASANKKFQDAAYARKQSEQFIGMLKTDPMAVLNDPNLGIDVETMLREYAREQLALENMTAEERELKESRNKLAEYEEARKAQERTDYERQMGELEQHHKQQYTSEIHEALEADGLPITGATVRRMAQYMSEALGSDDAGIKALTAKDITALVREDYITDFKEMFGSSDAETLEAILGADMSKTLRKADVAKLTKRNNQTTKPAKTKKSGGRKKGSEKFNQDQFDDYLDSL